MLKVLKITALSLLAIILSLLFLGSTLCAFSDKSFLFPGLIFTAIWGVSLAAVFKIIVRLVRSLPRDSITTLNLKDQNAHRLPPSPPDQTSNKEEGS